MDTLLSMRTFCLVVERSSFTAAAGSLDMSPAMASKHVMHLEARLGARLLNRSSRHVGLTEAGARYYERCREMLDELDEVETQLSGDSAQPRGQLRVSAPVWLANPGFVAVLADYHRQYPQVRLDLDLSGRMVNLVEEGFDLALRVSQNLGENLIARPVGQVSFVVVASPEYLARKGSPQRPDDLATHDWLAYSLFPAGLSLMLGELGVPAGTSVVPIMQSSNESLLRLAALQGMGLALLPTWLVADDLACGQLQQVLAGSPHITLHGVYPSRRHLSSRVRTFLDFLCADPRLR